MAEPNFQGLRPTGRQIKEPTSTLYELEGADGRVYTSIVFDEKYQGMEALTLNVQLVESFLAYPMVVGLVELGHHDIATATFSYPTGRVFTLMEVLRVYRDLGRSPGPRAAIEMMLLAAEILQEAGETGPIQGCFSHGNLNPFRIAVRLDGQLQVFGYGLAQVDLIGHRQDPSRYGLTPESVRYAPPERIEGQPEGPTADTYSLTAIAFEMATGRPLYDSLDPADLQRQIALSEGTSILSGRGHGLPNAVAKTFARALIYDPDTRLAGPEFLDELQTLLKRPDIEGDGLATIMEKMRGQQIATAPRGRKLAAVTGTELFTVDQLKHMADDEGEDAAPQDETESRWGRVSRRRRNDEAAVTAGPEPVAEDDGRRRLRRRTDEAPETASVSESEPDAADDAGRRRLRRRSDGPDAPLEPRASQDSPALRSEVPASPEVTSPGEPGDVTMRRRLRREIAPPSSTSPTEDAPESPTAEGHADTHSLRRRLRRDAAPQAPAVPAPSPPQDEAGLRRRLRRDETPTPATPEAAPDAEPNGLRRRLRRDTEGEHGSTAAARRLGQDTGPTDSTTEGPAPASAPPDPPPEGRSLRRLRRGD